MKLISQIAQVISLLFFAGYGVSCLCSKRMKIEFQRYRVGPIRLLTGFLQIMGSLGLWAGFYSRPLLWASSGSLALMMLVAVLVRIRIRDPLRDAVPALALFGLNLFIFWTNQM